MQSNELTTLYQEELYNIRTPLVILFSKPWNDLIEEELVTLNRMLHALKINLERVQILHRKEFTMAELSFLSPTRVLIFGATLNPPCAFYENIDINGISVIASEPLDQLDELKKKSLWTALQAMFNL
ncbi:MAG: hypothetical protein KBF45_13500 [Cyclobacteriaceae bacterium]|jgi:hypothetical protein|nr:hypothetical protein [Cyclobacteriaceae bacterium]